MNDTQNMTVFTILVAVEYGGEYLDSIHTSKESAEKRRKHLVEGLDYHNDDVMIEPRPVLSL